MLSLWHLIKRFFGSITASPLSAAEQVELVAMLLPAEYALFVRLATSDQRHALHVLRRFDRLVPAAPIAVRRAALLHDIGKLEAGLGTARRVAATVIGPRTKAFRAYREHERIGSRMLAAAGSDPQTVSLVRGEGDVAHVAALRRADAV
jgi:hypothetical protein